MSRVKDTGRTLLGPLWTTTFRDPVRTGRLRLDGLSGPERQLAKAGLVTLVLMLASLLVVGWWRRGTLLHLNVTQEPRFVPEGLVPVTLVALYLGLSLFVWGALAAAPSVRLLMAAVYAFTVGALGVPTVASSAGSWVLAHGATLVRVAFWVPIGALVLSALLSRARGVSGWLTPVLRTLCLLTFATMGVTQLWMHVSATEAGFQGGTQIAIHAGFTHIDGFLIPLIYLAALAVIDFATDVSTSLAEPIHSAPSRWIRPVKVLLLGLILAKLWIEVGSDRAFWRAYLTDRPQAVAYTLTMLAMLGAVTWWASRAAAEHGSDSEVDDAKERLELGGAVVLSVAIVIGILVTGLGELVLATTHDVSLTADIIGVYPTTDVHDVVTILGPAVALVAGLWLLLRGWSGIARGYAAEIGSGLVVIGAWTLVAGTVATLGITWGFSSRGVDVAVTVAVLVWLLVRWRTLDLAQASLIFAVLVFSWLVMSRGDYISFLGGLLGLPGIVVVVFGILYTLASGAAFTAASSRRFPRQARTLMFIGYLLLSVTILHWYEAIHQRSVADLHAYSAFYFLGIPLAAWLLARRIVQRRSAEGDAQAEDLRDPTSTTPSTMSTS